MTQTVPTDTVEAFIVRFDPNSRIPSGFQAANAQYGSRLDRIDGYALRQPPAGSQGRLENAIGSILSNNALTI